MYLHNNDIIKADSWNYYWEAITNWRLMQIYPKEKLQELFFDWGLFYNLDAMFGWDGALAFSDLGTKFIMKYMQFSTFFTLGTFYPVIIFYNAFFILGQLALLKTALFFQERKKYWFVFVIFFVPSVLFWGSGIHKEGFALSAIGFISWYSVLVFYKKEKKYLFRLILSFLLLFVVRHYFFLVLIIPYLFWVIRRERNYNLALFVLLPVVLFSSVFIFHLFFPENSPLKIIQYRQGEFQKLKGNSNILTPAFESKVDKLIENIPLALNHIFLRPYLNESDQWKYLFASIENLFVLFLMILLLLLAKRKNMNNAFFLFLLIFSLTICLFIGLTMTNLGAILRYKSIFISLILVALVGFAEIPFSFLYIQKEKK
ncbi:MAG: hypothetical protein KA275_07415 [Chitinophagaceae bacterium]|nr:hypothetical protein [Chitinophagaceae bacterium]